MRCKNGKSGRGSWADRARNERFPTYFDFGSSDFNETLRKCSWYEKNDKLISLVTRSPILAQAAHHLGPN